MEHDKEGAEAMNVLELNQEIPLLKETIDAVKKAEQITGKAIDFIWVEQMSAFAKLKAARHFMEKHIVYLRKDQSTFTNHLIVHECYHLFRFWSVDESQRKILSYANDEGQKMMLKWQSELGRKAEGIPSTIYPMWHNGIMTLFYNAVTDTRIERSMYKEYTGLRIEQGKSLKNQVNTVQQTLDKQIERMTPPSLFLLTGAMNYVFLKRLEPIIGRNWRKIYKGRADMITLANRLLRVIPEEDGGLQQDIAILNKWSEILGFNGIRWVDFADVPLDYVHQY